MPEESAVRKSHSGSPKRGPYLRHWLVAYRLHSIILKRVQGRHKASCTPRNACKLSRRHSDVGCQASEEEDPAVSCRILTSEGTCSLNAHFTPCHSMTAHSPAGYTYPDTFHLLYLDLLHCVTCKWAIKSGFQWLTFLSPYKISALHLLVM
jgi:hypothetical protein